MNRCTEATLDAASADAKVSRYCCCSCGLWWCYADVLAVVDHGVVPVAAAAAAAVADGDAAEGELLLQLMMILLMGSGLVVTK